MDVTSLLNAASAVQREAVARLEGVDTMDRHSDTSNEEEARYSSSIRTSSSEKSSSRRVSESKVPSRSRTPWDANGYALPLVVDTKSAPAPVRPLVYSESPIESSSPKSPRHKCSDSHSSLSSYASSSTSLSHSRISSMSTVGGVQPLSTIPDVSSLAIGSECLDAPKEFSLRQRRDGVLSPPPIIEEIQAHERNRFGSPSDAMLISKPSRGLQRLEAQRFHENSRPPRADFSLLVPPELSKAHKRTVSAPNFASVQSFDRTFPPLLGNLRPSISLATSTAVRQTHGAMNNPPLPPTPNGGNGTGQCMYSVNCDTGSQLRKVVSHIFGRNKNCTRQIPASCWVHYCRKHYQRSRYRNTHEFTLLQVDLVLRQIRLIDNWSGDNKANGRPGVVQNWALSMRKREATRLQDKSKKRRYRDVSNDNDGEDDDDYDDYSRIDDPREQAAREKADRSGTAVPKWLQDKCGKGYNTDEILAIITELQNDIIEKKSQQIPDIEVLPNLSTDDTDESQPKTKRKSSYPQQKRRRLSDMPTSYGTHQFASPLPSLASPSMSNMSSKYSTPASGTPLPSLTSPGMSSSTAPLRSSSQLPFRPGPFAARSQAQPLRAEEFFSGPRRPQMSHNNYGRPSPTPPTQRFNNATPTTHPHANPSAVDRNAHHRSVSAFGSMPPMPSSSSFNFDIGGQSTRPSINSMAAPSMSRAASAGEYGFTGMSPHSTYPAMGNMSNPQTYTQLAASNYNNQDIPSTNSFASHNGNSSWAGMNMMDRSSYMAPGHSRHQSTPTVSHAPATRFSPSYNHNSVYSFTNGGFTTPHMGNYQPHAMNPSHPYPTTESSLFCDPPPVHNTPRPSTQSSSYSTASSLHQNQGRTTQPGLFCDPSPVHDTQPPSTQSGSYGTVPSVRPTQPPSTQPSQFYPSPAHETQRPSTQSVQYNASSSTHRPQAPAAPSGQYGSVSNAYPTQNADTQPGQTESSFSV